MALFVLALAVPIMATDPDGRDIRNRVGVVLSVYRISAKSP